MRAARRAPNEGERTDRAARRGARPVGAEGAGRRGAVLGLFAVSGVSGLVYEVVWTRQLTLVFGATGPAVTTVLTTFMLGLAVGSRAAGRWSPRWSRPLRAYAGIELMIAGYAVAFPVLLRLLSLAHVPLFRLLADRPLALAAVRVGLVAALLLPPTLLMGASLPVLTRALVSDVADFARTTGALYGLNTLGAALGVCAASFVLVPRVGLLCGTLAAAALNVLVAAIAWGLNAGARAAAAPPLPGPAARLSRRRGLLAYALSGLAALGYEVVWTRLLVLVFGSSVYAFAIMLSSFLLGVGLGSCLGGRLAARVRDPSVAVAALQVAVGAGVLAGVPWFDRLPKLFVEAYRLTGGEWSTLTTAEFAMALAIMVGPTTAMGATFPLVARLLGDGRPAERAVAEAYAANTWGAILGAATTGFALIPWLGFRGALLVLVTLNVGAAALVLAPVPGRRRRWALPAAGALLVLGAARLPGWNPKALASGPYVYAEHYTAGRYEKALEQQRLLFYREGPTATIAVLEGRWRFLRINGKTDAGDSPDNLTQRLLAHVPMLLHPEPRAVLVVGLGTGITLGTVLLYPVDHVDAVEISPEVVEASRFFTEANGRALEDRRTRLHLLDARTWVMATARQYDVIISEPSNPWQTGNASLFTLEHYRSTRERLAAGGVFCQWLPFYRMDEQDFRAAIRTLQTVFPLVTVWFSGGDVLLVATKPASGSDRPAPLDLPRFLARAGAGPVAQSLRSLGIPGGGALLGFFLLDPERVREYAGDRGPLHTDDYPLLEFSAPKTLYRESAPYILDRLRQLAARSALPPLEGDAATAAAVYDEVARTRLGLRMPQAALAAAEQAVRLGGATPERRRLQAAAWNDLGVALRRRGDLTGARRALEQAAALAPEVPETRLNLGVTLAEGVGDLVRAEREIREALRLRPAYREALIGLARVLEAQGRRAAAELAWTQVLMADPDNDEARQSLALLRRPSG